MDALNDMVDGAVFSMGGIVIEVGSSGADDNPIYVNGNVHEKPLSPPHSPLKTIHRMDSIAEEPTREHVTVESTSSQPIELTVMQLLPDFDGELEDMAFEEPVSYTQEELSNLQTEVRIDENVASVVLMDPAAQLSTSFLPPCVLQLIADSTDDVESLDPEKAKKAFRPLLIDRLSSSLSVTQDGFIQMNDYKISFDSMGGGRLSEVRVAFNEKDQQQYAVKILSKRKMENYNLLLRKSRNPLEEAYREIGILKRLDHPNIIQLVEVVDNAKDDNIYIVFELLDQALLDLPTESPFAEAEARKYFKEILCGVEYLHSQKIVHRDLKPDNMLLSKHGRVKIADFGFCDEASDNEETSESEIDSPPAEPEVSAVSGTPAFTPPECLRTHNKHVSGYALDIWSLGVTLYSLVVGDVPFKGDNMPQLFKSITNDPIEYPPNALISPMLDDLVRRLLTKDPKKRIKMEEVKNHPWLMDDDEVEDVKGEVLSSVLLPKEVHHLRS